MTFNEFRAWLEGFEASFKQHGPDAEQWAAIKAKLASVSAVLPASPAPSGAKWPSIEPYRPVPLWTGGPAVAYDQAQLNEKLAGNVIEFSGAAG